MPPLLDRLLDVLLVLLAGALHLWAAGRADALPPDGVFEAVVVAGPLLADLAAVVLLVRTDRRGLQVACVVAWLLVLFALPSGVNGLRFVPSAVLLSVALARPRPLSSGRSGAG